MNKKINNYVKSAKQYVRSMGIISVAFMVIFISGCKSKTDATVSENNKNQIGTNISQEQKSTSANDKSTSSTDKNGQSEEIIIQLQTDNAQQNITETSTQMSTQTPTQKPTEKVTQASTQKPAETPTQEPTEAPIQAPTQKPTEKVTQAPTQKPTETPTQKPTEAPTQAPTQKPTETPTQKPTEAPTISGGINYAAEVETNLASYMSYYEEVLKLVNEIRAEAGVEPLVLDTQLCKAATHRSIEMEYANLFSHTRPDGSRCFTVFATYGISYGTAGENIAAGQSTPEIVVEGWKNSAGHYANMINKNFKKLGVGLSKKGIATYRTYWTQLFTD